MKNIIIPLLVLTIVFCSCSRSGNNKSKENSQSGPVKKENLNSAGIKEGDHEFTVQYEKPRKIYRIDKEDLNNDGNKEIIVLSSIKDTTNRYSDYYNFDMIEVFALNSDRKSYVKIFVDTADYADSIIYVDLLGNKNKEILISTNSGGNNEIVSRGMFVYEMTSPDKINLLKYFDTGAPRVKDIRNNGKKEILVSDLFYGVMPQNEAIEFVKEIYKLENHNLIISNGEFGEFYDSKLKEALEKYNGTKKKIEMGMQPGNLSYPMYRESAEVIINYYAKDDLKGLKKFWDEEKEILKKNIPDDEFLDLSNFILKALPSSRNA